VSLGGVPLRDALDSAVVALQAAGVDTPRLDAEVLLAHVLGLDRARLVIDSDRAVEGGSVRAFQDAVRRRAISREPVAYITGVRGFRRLDLHVDGRVLIPRPETETLVEAALELPHGARVVDVGTGSGAIALAIAQERQGVRVTGIDNSPDAIDVARTNAERNGLEVEFMIADLIVGGPYDLIVSNPPYVRESEWAGLAPEITLYEPREALLAGPDGLDVIRDLVPAAADALVRGGMLAVEVGQGQSRAVEALFEKAGLRAVETDRDLAGIPRVVRGRR
jgi:release factor glutamine methyltransferase